jgi:uncharacterized SAM-binding protein YcdF (DUF218 family)
VALAKCRTGLDLLERQPDWQLLPTGGFGEHFNRAALPHWRYVHAWLSEHAVPASRLLDGVASTNTLDDAVFSRGRLLELYDELPPIRVLTCAYHLKRARWIFDRVFGPRVVQFVAAPDPDHDPMLIALEAHEPRSLEWHRAGWDELFAASRDRWAALQGATPARPGG